MLHLSFKGFRGYSSGILHATAAAAAAAFVIIPLCVRDYRIYMSYGPGGLPYNLFGWLVSTSLRPLSREQFSTQPYDGPNLFSNDESGNLGSNSIPRRISPRPRIGPHPIPQRQLSQLPDVEVCQRLITAFANLGKHAQDQGLVDIKQSMYERQHSALFVSTSRPWHPVAQETRGEIAHVHAGKDGSIHVVLHPKDCTKVIEHGWGQRHAFSGVSLLKRVAGFMLPVNYVLVYAPRNDAEIETVLKIVKASIQFMTGSRQKLEHVLS